MANTKISDLTAVDTLAGDDDFAIADTSSAASKRATGTQISTFVASATATLTNKTFDANGSGNSLSNVDVADLSVGTDGELITWDASGNPTTVPVGTATHVLTSNGAGAAPTFQAASGGGGGLDNVVEDTTPQLGGDLDMNGNQITSPDGTDLIDIPNGSVDIQTASTSRLDVSDTGVRLGGANARVTTVLDEDNMASDSATALATQQSIKAYIDGGASGITAVVEDTTPQLGGDLDMNGNQITSPDGTDLMDIPNGSIDLQTASTSRLDISDSGVRMGAGNARVTTILDEDNMASDSATALATQQSIKAYIDGGASGITAVVDDTTPQLGGQLDVNGQAIGDGTRELLTFTEDASAVNHINIENEATGSPPIVSATGDDTNIDIKLHGKGTGNVMVCDGTDPTKAISFEVQSASAGAVTTLQALPGSSCTVTLPTSNGTMIHRTSSDTLTNKTLTSAVLNTGVSGTAVLDEDDMTSDSATQLATQQSIKAYVDAQAGGISNVVEDTTPQLGGNLDTNDKEILIDGGRGIQDESGNEQLLFATTASAITHLQITNGASGNGPTLKSLGETNTDMTIDTNGTGTLTLGSGDATIHLLDSSTGDVTSSGLRLGGLNARVTTILDEDAMGTNSATALATQQSIKAYADTKVDPDVAQEYTATQNFNATTLTDQATIAWDASANQVCKVTLAGSRTMGAPTNLVDGGTYILRVIQDGTGSRTITWNAVFKWAGGTAPTLSTGANDIDLITFVSDGTNLYGVASLDFS